MKVNVVKSEAEVLVGVSSIWYEGEAINVPGVPARNYLKSESVATENESAKIDEMIAGGLKVLRVTRYVG